MTSHTVFPACFKSVTIHSTNLAANCSLVANRPQPRTQVAPVGTPPANSIPIHRTGSRQRLRACNPADSHALQSDHCSGDFQRHSEFAIPGSPILPRVLQPQLDGRAFFHGIPVTDD